MDVLQRVYDHSPIPFQNLMCTVSGYTRNYNRYGRVYWDYRSFLEDFDSWSLLDKERYQLEQLKEFVSFAKKCSAFYAALYRDFDVSDITCLKDLKKLPIVDKEALRKNEDAVSTIPKSRALVSTTGGTTGKVLEVRYTREDCMRRMAILDHFRARNGFENRKMKRAIFNAKYIVPPKQTSKVFWRYNHACKQMIYSSFHLSQENIPYYIENLNEFKPDAIEGYFTSMCDIANYMERHSIKPRFRPVAIFPTSETVTKEGRESLERVFCCEVFDQYASSEGAPFVTECSKHHKHLELVDGVIEHIDESDSEILVTSFLTHGTPLIRYRIGDNMVFSKSKHCCCGRDGRLVDMIQGRSLDYLYTTDGAKVTEFDILLDCLGKMLIHAQFIQNEKSAVTILIQIDENYYLADYETRLMDGVHRCLGDDMKAQIIIVDEIPREKSGKFRLILNRCDS